MEEFKNISITDFDYHLPEEKIALFPAETRDASKMLIFKDNQIVDSVFSHIDNFLPSDSILIMNDTRVIRARLNFRKESGALIEVFCLEPLQPYTDIQLAMQQTNGCVWKCLVGNAKKWKKNLLFIQLNIGEVTVKLSAQMISKDNDTYKIAFEWNHSEITFSEIIEAAGIIPLPPYITRKAVDEDYFRYQTVFSKNDGSVAAPTAGLHFTEDVLQKLAGKNISTNYLTLHVGAGTFKPVKSDDVSRHIMHTEQIIVKKSLIKKIVEQHSKIIAVGTTSVRSLESLYAFGLHYYKNKSLPSTIKQWDIYKCNHDKTDVLQVMESLLNLMERDKLEVFSFNTAAMIVPGYKFRIVDGMITNFHQPRSTLLLLISAFTGDSWKKIYHHALDNNYRFLSYGDACLFL